MWHGKEKMEKIAVTKEKEGMRIDKFLAEEFFLYSRGEITKKIKQGELKIKEKTVKPSYVLQEGDVLVLENFSREREAEILLPNEKIVIKVLLENENVIFIDKQAGIQAHPSYNEKENTLVNGLIAKFPEIVEVHDGSEGAIFRPGIVHRLDKETSGVMVIARNKKSFEELKNLFKERKVEKKYIAIVEGLLSKKEGVIEKQIARATSYSKQVIARKNTKTTVREAITEFRVLQECENCSLIEATPKTGRMHQIRVHFASIGHPVLGDVVYGQKNSGGKGLKRHLLHAKSINFELGGKHYEVSSNVPSEFFEFCPELKN